MPLKKPLKIWWTARCVAIALAVAGPAAAASPAIDPGSKSGEPAALPAPADSQTAPLPASPPASLPAPTPLPSESTPAASLPPGAHPTAVKVIGKEPPLAAVAGAPTQAEIDADLWQRVRRGFALAELNSPLVIEHEQWYANRPDYIQRFVDRGSKYLYYVVQEVERRGMPTEVAILPIIESAFNPQAYSRAKAAGMWQFIPSTGKIYGLKQDWQADHRRDVLASTHAALDYLEKLYGMFNSWELAFAAYNCGEGCVGRAIERNARKKLPTHYLALNLPNETRHYVPKLIAVKNIILSPASYGIELEAVENRPYFRKVAAPERIDIRLAARLAEMPEDEFAALNPAFTKPVATMGHFLVPAEKADTFVSNLALYKSLDGPLVSWQAASARRGESVDAAARRYGLTASYLRATNGPLPERRGKFTQNVSLMVPMQKEASIINATFDRKVQLKAAQLAEDFVGPPYLPAALLAQVSPAPAAPAPTPAATIHVVQAGDTLFSIAGRHGLTVDELKRRNGLKTALLQAGQSLQLADLPADDNASISPSPSLVKVAAATATLPVRQLMHVVASGDTLFSVAAKYGVALTDLMKWNKLGKRAVLKPGLKLRIAN